MADAKQFALDLGKEFAATQTEAVAFMRDLVGFGLSSFARLTPVDTGRARNSYQIGIGTRPSGQASGIGVQLVGLQAMRQIPREIYLVNNLIYIGFLDDGSSKQAPQGMSSTIVPAMRAKIIAAGGGVK